MSVFTPVSASQLRAFLAFYRLGELTDFAGIPAGVENTNYFIDADQDRYVLTLFEQHDAEEMPYFLNLMLHLYQRKIPCPQPIADRYGNFIRELNGRPAALVRRLDGHNPGHPNSQQCMAIGKVLGELHQQVKTFTPRRENDRSPKWWRQTAHQLREKLSVEDARILDEELRFQSLCHFPDLPRGTIHADLFRDNALFSGDHVTGLIDFYYACHDALLYDVAVTVNDWCSLQGVLDYTQTQTLLHAYHEQRPLTAIERGAWPVMLRAAALRFWLSRLLQKHYPRPGELIHIKEPNEFKTILLARRETEVELQSYWVN